MNLNLNEQLLRDTKDAHICIFIANLASWLRFNIDKENPAHRNIREGRCWSYNTIKDLHNYFDFWSVKNIRTIIKHCQEQGLILVGNFNKNKYDKTSWYTLTDKALEYYPVLKERFQAIPPKPLENTDLPETANGFAGSGKPIPEKHNSLSSINTTTSDFDKSQEVVTSEIVDAYHEELPDSPRIRVVDEKLKRQLRKMVKNWPKFQREGQKFSIQSFRDYLAVLKTHYGWITKPYQTDSGNTRYNSLRLYSREVFISKIVNGEFSSGQGERY